MHYKNLFAFLLTCLAVLCAQSCKQDVSTITYLEVPAINKSSEPSLLLTDEGNIYLSWIDTDSLDYSTLMFSTLKGEVQWSDPVTIASGDDWFVNWADFPSLTAFGNNNLAAHYLQKSAEDTFAYDVMLTVSNDNGSQWNSAFSPHNDQTNTEHGFVSKVESTDGQLLSIWLDGRQYAYAEQDTMLVKQMSLRAAMINKQGSVEKNYLIDNRVCDCCQTDVAMTREGPIVVYRDRSDGEIRDIYYSRLINGTWTQPKAVFDDLWEIAGCPVNGPAIVAKDEQVAVTWFTAADNNPQIKVAFSEDSGATFGNPVLLDFDNPLGRLDIVSLDDNSVLVSWMDNVEGHAVIQMQQVFRDGTLSAVHVLSKTSESRSSGFPRMVVKGQNLYMAWTEVGESLDVKSIKVNLDHLK